MTAKLTASADGSKVLIGTAAEDALEIDATAKTIKALSPYSLAKPSANYVVSFAPSTGAFSNADSIGKYVRIGSFCLFTVDINIIDAGTASGALMVTLPFPAAIGAACAGRERALTGKSLNGSVVANSNILTCSNYDGTVLMVDGAQPILTLGYIVAEGS
jgi:hypothetical protein